MRRCVEMEIVVYRRRSLPPSGLFPTRSLSVFTGQSATGPIRLPWHVGGVAQTQGSFLYPCYTCGDMPGRLASCIHCLSICNVLLGLSFVVYSLFFCDTMCQGSPGPGFCRLPALHLIRRTTAIWLLRTPVDCFKRKCLSINVNSDLSHPGQS